jgi:hypothetical protein
MKQQQLLFKCFAVKTDTNLGASQFRHLQAVVELIEKFLRGIFVRNIVQTTVRFIVYIAVCKLHSEQRAVRVKKATDMKRMSRLATLVGDGPPSTPITQQSNRLQTVDLTVVSNDDTTTNDNATSIVRRRKPIVSVEKVVKLFIMQLWLM